MAEGDFFLMDDATSLAFKGTVYGHGDTVVVLANQGSNETFLWDALVKPLQDKGFVVVTFAYSIPETGYAPIELGLVMDQVIQKGGYQRVVCIGGSMGAAACAGEAKRPQMVGLALLAGPNVEDLSQVPYPKLFVTGDTDPCCATTTKGSYEKASEPKTLKVYPTDIHAVGLFSSAYKDDLTTLLVNFVAALP